VKNLSGLLLLALLSAGCGALNRPTTSPESPQPLPAATSTPAPAPSPTPRPALLLVGEAQDPLTTTLQSWAEQRGWEFLQAGEVGAEAMGEVAAAVLVGAQGEAELVALSAAGVPVVALDLEGVSAGPRISAPTTAAAIAANRTAAADRSLTDLAAGSICGLAKSTRISRAVLTASALQTNPIASTSTAH